MSDSEDVIRVAASLFDGRTSRPIPVWLSVAGGLLSVRAAESGDELFRMATAGVMVDEPLGAAPRRIGLPQGAFCELAAGQELDELLAALGHRESALSRWQLSTRRAALALALVATMLAAGYMWGLPVFAGWLSRHVPAAVEDRIGSSLLATLDAGKILSASHLPEARRRAITVALADLQQHAGTHIDYHLNFRNAPEVGPNAFALPGGEVVVTDQLVDMAPTPDHVAAVLAHELGHVRERHVMRQLVQASVVGMVVAVWFGDVGSVATGLASAVLENRYSRDMERQADDLAAGLLRAGGRSPALLADMLERLTGGHAGGKADEVGADFLSSHPSTPERIRRLRGA